MLVPIADLSVIFLTYDEPKKEEFWVRLKNIAPWASRVDGVNGSDAAHKAAAAASETDRFILIDGDNIPDADFFDQSLILEPATNDCVFRWRARNHINGLVYGNGGISCWTRTFVNNMRTHEASNGDAESNVEFCFDPKYIALHNCYSTTYPNGSEFHAWRAGFREGVKMTLDRGTRISLQAFEKKVHSGNYRNLCTWHSVGADIEYGRAAMDGAKLGTYLTMCTEWDYTEVQSFDALATLWNNRLNYNMDEIALILQKKLSLPIAQLSPDASKFFKYYALHTHQNREIMLKAFQ